MYILPQARGAMKENGPQLERSSRSKLAPHSRPKLVPQSTPRGDLTAISRGLSPVSLFVWRGSRRSRTVDSGARVMNALDLLVIALYAAVVLWIGFASARRRPSSSELLLGQRRLPTLAVLFSMVATELSAATFIGVPHAAYTGDWFFLQLAFGALAAKWLLAWRVIPFYHRRGLVTVYGFLDSRFGPRARRIAALCFVGWAEAAQLFRQVIEDHARLGKLDVAVFEHRYRSRESESSNFNARHYVLVFQTRSQYTGYDLSINVGVRRSLERLIDTPTEQEQEFTQFFVQARVL